MCIRAARVFVVLIAVFLLLVLVPPSSSRSQNLYSKMKWQMDLDDLMVSHSPYKIDQIVSKSPNFFGTEAILFNHTCSEYDGYLFQVRKYVNIVSVIQNNEDRRRVISIVNPELKSINEVDLVRLRSSLDTTIKYSDDRYIREAALKLRDDVDQLKTIITAIKL